MKTKIKEIKNAIIKDEIKEDQNLSNNAINLENENRYLKIKEKKLSEILIL